MLFDKKTITSVLCSLVFCSSLFSTQKPHLYILMHGSFASPKHMTVYGNKLHWCQPGHKTYELLKTNSGATLINHPWSGGTHLSDLIAGAKSLIVLIKKYAPSHTISIIAHSNGGNVALLALDTLVRKTNRPVIQELVLLGTPLYLSWYPESVKAAQRIYNLFSYGDVIQPVFGHYERLLPEHAHIFNIQVTMDNIPATHNQLYKAEIMQLIPQFSLLFARKDTYRLDCTTGAGFSITRDTQRDADSVADKAKIHQLPTDNNQDGWFTRLKNKKNHYHQTVTAFIGDIKNALEDIN